MSSIASARFYVYVLCRPNGDPFYVGKGQDARVFDHDAEARRGHKCHKCNVIRKIWKQGGQVQRYIVFETDDEQEAFNYERELITLYGRDTLANLTDGGDGASGARRSTETRTKQSVALKAARGTPEARAASRDRMLRMYEEDPAVVEKISAAAKARWANPEFRARASAAMRAAKARPETQIRIRAANKATANRPEAKARSRALGLAFLGTPEGRAAASERMKQRWADPEKRAALQTAIDAGIKQRRNKS